ncbi:MAG: hypothetical protein AB1512_03840 [Thermodesulfobacteriota bacterium]
MIPCSPGPEPERFDARTRKRGLRWLAKHPKPAANTPGKQWRPRDYWSEFRNELADAFRQLCAYGAMYEPVGTVDHFISCDTDETKAYEWSNYRFCSQWINSSKQTSDAGVLDPCDVKDGWFKIILPSLQLVLGDRIPANRRKLAEDTLTRLHLKHDERIIRQRRVWYELYQSGRLSLGGLRQIAPLIARAVEEQG